VTTPEPGTRRDEAHSAEQTSTGVVRDAVADDALEIAAMHRASALTAYRGILPEGAPEPAIDELAGEWRRLIADAGAEVIVAGGDGHVVGCAVARQDPDEARCGQLCRLYVAPGEWGRGIGPRLHDEALRRLVDARYGRASLWVLEANERARRMYECRAWRLVPGKVLTWPGLGVTEVRYERPLP
jgi:GNAT superfamily N-acetyltransferase